MQKIRLNLFPSAVGALLPRDPVLQEECRRHLARGITRTCDPDPYVQKLIRLRIR